MSNKVIDNTNKGVIIFTDRQNNSLSLIKLLAALQVVFGHISIHLNLSISPIVETLVGFFQGVPIFFILSGLLIWNSINRTNTYSKFIKKRFLRIYPELWMCIAIEILTIVIFYNGWNLRDLSIFTLTQGTIFQFWTPNSLRGYGCGTPNGTLWTICVTIQFYLIVWLVHRVFHNKNVRCWSIGIVVSIAVSVFGHMFVEVFNNEIFTKLYGQTILRYGWLFFWGCFLAEYKSHILPILTKYWFIPLLLGLIPYLTKIDIYAGYSVLVVY